MKKKIIVLVVILLDIIAIYKWFGLYLHPVVYNVNGVIFAGRNYYDRYTPIKDRTMKIDGVKYHFDEEGRGEILDEK